MQRKAVYLIRPSSMSFLMTFVLHFEKLGLHNLGNDNTITCKILSRKLVQTK